MKKRRRHFTRFPEFCFFYVYFPSLLLLLFSLEKKNTEFQNKKQAKNKLFLMAVDFFFAAAFLHTHTEKKQCATVKLS